jgi:hypothetical protein
MRTRLIAAAGLALALLAPPAAQAAFEPTLTRRAVLPAETFAPGPPSGAAIAPAGGAPFPSQPVQGFSGLLAAGGGDVWALVDNGYGTQANSADFLLRVYRIHPDFQTRRGGSGTVTVERFLSLRDPDRRIPFPLVREDDPQRLLTGADFDPESFQRARDGTLWFGDEFGPWLLHTDASGRVLEAPVPLPGVQAPETGGSAATLPASGGFEGMGISRDGRTLYPMLEKALVGDPDPQRRVIYAFDVRTRRYTGRTWTYRVEDAGNSATDLTRLDRHRFLVVERDAEQGPAARLKAIYRVDLRDGGPALAKRQVLDLLDIRHRGIPLAARPGDIGLGDPFTFPFITTEAVLALGGRRLLVANDNNFPFSMGRNPQRPDDDELIVVRVPGLRAG